LRTFVLAPHEGVDPVRLGMDAAEVRAAMQGIGFTHSEHPRERRDLFVDNAFQVFYDGDGRAEYIELSFSNAFIAEFEGVAVLQSAADDAVEAVAARAALNQGDPELGWSFVFPDLDLALWRPTREDESFSTVGVGVEGYFSRPEA
jgi:hypothetical protein